MTAANTILIPNSWRNHVANLFNETASSTNAYFLFVGDHQDHSNTALQPLTDKVNTTLISTWRDMIQGKRVGPDDVMLLCRNIPYESNKVFDMYDDQEDLSSKDFYAIVNAASYFHVFKCLDNNLGANSTVEPNFADISGANTSFYETSDGYIWKYMYTVSSATERKFATSTYFPVSSNSTVSDAAVAGAINTIKIEYSGYRYDNYITGTFTGADLRVNGDPRVYAIANNIAKTTNGFYTGCLLYLSDGTGAGQYKVVTDYISSISGNFVVVEEQFDTAPLNGTSFEIYPNVIIRGSGAETVNAVARALINAVSSNSIYKIEMLEVGAGYNYASANVAANAVVSSVRSANLRPIYPPNHGHGADPASELLARRAEVSVTLANNEENTILTSNKFQQVGIMHAPLFANVEMAINSHSGSFITNETILQANIFFVVGGANVLSNSTLVEAADGSFEQQFAVGDYVYLTIANNDVNQLGVVNSIVNSSQLTLTTNGYFDAEDVLLYTIQSHADAVLSEVVSAGTIRLTNVAGEILGNDFIIGVLSGSIATVNTVSHNDVVKNYETFVQLYKYSGTVSFGTFEENEVVYQNDSTAMLYSAIVDGANVTIYTSNQVGIFETGDTVTGNTSGAIMTVNDKYSPELVFGSGEVLYLENIDPVTRQEDQTETFKLSFNF